MTGKAVAIGRTEEAEIWNALYNERDADPEDARNFADSVIALIQRGRLYNEEQLQQVREVAKKKRRQARNEILGICAFIGALFAILGGGITLIILTNPHTYGGYSRGAVPGHAESALVTYFGTHGLPGNLVATETRKSQYIGRPAWYVRYRAPLTGKIFCAYVWSTNEGENNHGAVYAGKQCVG